MSDAIGTAVEQECQMRWYEKEVPGLLHKLKRSIGMSQGYSSEVLSHATDDEQA